MNPVQSLPDNLVTVAATYHQGAIAFARELCQQKQIAADWLVNFEHSNQASRVAAKTYERLLDEAAQRLNEPMFGFKYGQQIDISSFNLLGYLAMSSATLAAASQVVNQYGVLVSEIGQLIIEDPARDCHGSKPLVKILWLPRNPNDICSSQVIDGVLAGWIQFGKKFLGERAQIHSLHLTTRPIGAENYQAILGCPVSTNSQENFILIDRQLFALPLKQAEPMVHAAIQLKAEQAIKTIHHQAPPLAKQISEQLPGLIFNGEATLDELAARLKLTTRSLQRKLKQDSLSFRALLDDARRHLTLQLLEENEQPLVNICGIVGFNDQSSFNRAFKRWTGQSPRQYLAAQKLTR